MKYTSKCQKCNELFLEEELQESHNVPCYMFRGKTRNERKQKADSFGRKLLCKKCHDIYEKKVFANAFNILPTELQLEIIARTNNYANNYFKKELNE